MEPHKGPLSSDKVAGTTTWPGQHLLHQIQCSPGFTSKPRARRARTAPLAPLWPLGNARCNVQHFSQK
jgi:hypothetical protein